MRRLVLILAILATLTGCTPTYHPIDHPETHHYTNNGNPVTCTETYSAPPGNPRHLMSQTCHDGYIVEVAP